MKKTAVMLLTLLVAIAGMSLPIWVAMEESQRQAYTAESAHALGYARDVVLRGNETGRQLQTAVAQLERHAEAPCSPQSIDDMRRLDLGSTYIQAIGYVEGDRMLCSSIAGAAAVLELGAPDYAGASGALVRTDVRFPFAPQQSFVVIQSGRFAGILHSELAIDTARSEPDVSLALVSLDYPAPLSVRGRIDPGWVARLGRASEAVFEEGGNVVAVARSDRYRTAGIAAVPVHYLRTRMEHLALRLIPAGLAAGIVLTLAVLYFVRQQMALPSAVRSALRRRELFLEYQPVVDLRSGAWIGVEALVRWRRPTGEVVPPDLFIPIAEQNAMIVLLTRQVLEQVCRDTGFYLQLHPEFHIGINVAPADFHSPEFVADLHEALRRTGAQPASLILEVTERGLLDPVVARETTGVLRRHGFALAIDDFGTGYSSLSYLESLELDYLKIDRSFIEAIGTGAPTSQVVGHIIRMANDLGLRMIAEGVESHAQADFLRKQGVQYAQGWLFGRPVAFAEIVRRMEEMAENAALSAAV
ncbi:EAL domain-containing protein [Massilia sp. 9I]|uniref:EAL domain-containing protein n=1 Tax=Massilia sp. 9I TaxID=2653152 RepID=UPI0012EF3431|nr:EAL domain-containing protein [Massilia sp. 9I]VXB78891.1 Putative signal transduction protein containing sensor and EAL domain containing protein [Massilia sp. 9I]